MTEEGDNPIVSGEVQSTAMESLNDEFTPETEKPQHEVKSENNIQHEISGFKKFLTTSVQVIRLHWMPILISSIVCFVFNGDIAEISLARNLFALSFNAFVILLMVTSIEGKKDSVIVKMEREVKTNTAEIENLQRKLEAKQAEFDQHKEECKSDKKVVMAQIKSKSVESENLKRELKEKQADFDQHKEECELEKKSLIATMKYNFKFKSAEIKNFKKTEGELKSRISLLEDGAKTVNVRNNFKAKNITLSAQFIEISQLAEVNAYSESTKFEGITWKMSVRKSYIDDYVFCLYAEKDNAVKWWCPVIVELCLVSQIHQKSHKIVRKEMIFTSNIGAQGFGIIPLEDLFNEEKGYVKDNSIIVEVVITVLPTN